MGIVLFELCKKRTNTIFYNEYFRKYSELEKTPTYNKAIYFELLILNLFIIHDVIKSSFLRRELRNKISYYLYAACLKHLTKELHLNSEGRKKYWDKILLRYKEYRNLITEKNNEGQYRNTYRMFARKVLFNLKIKLFWNDFLVEALSVIIENYYKFTPGILYKYRII